MRRAGALDEAGGSNGPRRYDERGSLAVELVLLTPALFIVILTIVAFGRVSASRQQVVDAASAGTEAASVSRDAASAASAAETDARDAIAGHAHTCERSWVSVDTSHFLPAGFVTVTVSCQVALSDLSLPGVPGSRIISASSTSPIDRYRVVGS